jgi:integrase
LRDFLARNHVPYQWIDVELSANDTETKRLLDALRHGRVSMLRASGTPDELVKDWVGHSSLNSRRDGDITSPYTHFEDEFRQVMAAKTGLFAQQNLAEDLRFSPNGPNFGHFASSAEAR